MKELIDEAFYVEECPWKTWKSYDKNANPLITSLTEDACVSATRQYLKWKQENRLNDTGVSYKNTVNEKL